MEFAPGPVTRTFTAPASHNRLHNTSGSSIAQSQSGSQYSSYSQPFRSSDSTQGTSQSLLFSPLLSSASPPNGGPVEASNNVINRVADKDTSLFQICVTLRNRLQGVPGFEEQLLDVLHEEQDAEDEMDPVTLLWRTFRRGYPLMTIYNALQPEVPLEIDESKVAESRREKTAAFKFLNACVNQLKFPTQECFIISDLYGDDTTGFVKVAKVVNRVVDILVQQGFLASPDGESGEQGPQSSIKKTQRQHIVDELVRTERTYVQHLEVLQSFKKLVEQKGIISGDAIHNIFLNLDALLDFQRRFLIRVEQTNALPENYQNWGKLFTLYADAFKVYEPYIANQRNCEGAAMRDFDKLKEAGGPPELRQVVESPTHLTSFLLKPFQRLSKYPLLLKELRNKGDLDEERKADIVQGIQAASSVLERTNAYIDLEERLQAVRDLKNQVEDWKGHRVEAFGELLLHGNFTVLKGDSSRDSEREYKIYLFERILLCCKEANPNKQKGKIISKSQQNLDRRGKPRLQLKGRIFMQNVTETILLAKPGSYTCQIFWRGDDAIEYFVIRFTTEEIMKKWCDQVEIQRRQCVEAARMKLSTGTSETEFTYIREQGALENPYMEDEGIEDDDYDGTYSQMSNETILGPSQSEFSMSRNGSSTSLRSRSTAGEAGILPPLNPARGAPARYPPSGPGAPLTLRTHQLPGPSVSPADRAANSYFSPGAESPISSRTSSSSGMFPFPRQSTPSNGWHNDDQTRYTAPAMGRNHAKDGNQIYGYDRGMRGQQNGVVPHPAAIAQTRLRSASSPDVHVPSRRIGPSMGHDQQVPEVPPVPSHLAHSSASISRSQNNSPNNINGIPSRAATQSPNAKRPIHMHTASNSSFHQNQYVNDGVHHEAMAPPPFASGTSGGDGMPIPTQLKVKVKVPSEGSTMTLVCGVNISYQSLKDRIDAKLQRHTNLSLAAGNVKLKYMYDGELVSIQDDEDVQTAFETWREQDSNHIMAGQLGEIELYVQR